MIRVRFVLAVPRDRRVAELPVMVSSPSHLLADSATLWVEPGTPCCSLGDNGLMLGVRFNKTNARPVARAAELIDPEATLGEMARHLLAEYWGAFVAILIEPQSRTSSLLVDPSGLLPLYRCDRSDHTFYTTDPALAGAVPSYRDIASHLLRPELRHRRTCLADCDELPPGSMVRLGIPRDRPLQIWLPEVHFPTASAPRFEDAAAELRGLATTVMGSWSGLLGRLGVAASGGVDSSFVCAALSSAETAFDCITVATSDRSGDERQSAAAVARQFGVKCVEREFDPVHFNPCEPASRGLPRPARRAFLSVFDRLLDDAREELGAVIVLDGNNGDNLFCYLHSAAPIVDRLRAEGWSSGVIETLFDMCRITDCSLPTMVAATGRRLVRGGARDRWPSDRRLLADDVSHAGSAPLTPWLDEESGKRSGKRDHLLLLMHAQNHLHGVTGSLRRFSPLASQPLVEFCLGVPTWLWASGGMNRALARAAFASRLPAPIIARTSKAGPDSFIRLAFAHNRSRIRERLLDGLLASNGLLDRTELNRALDVDEFRDALIIDRILDILEAENWARSWTR